MTRRKTGVVAVALAAVAAVAAIAAATAPAATRAPIVIGWAYDGNGAMAPFDGPALAATIAAAMDQLCPETDEGFHIDLTFRPDATGLLAFMLDELSRVIEGLVVFPERMRENLDAHGGIAFSQPMLLALVDAGLPRDDAYRVVQRAAAAAWDEGASFRDVVSSDPEVRRLQELSNLGYRGHSHEGDAIGFDGHYGDAFRALQARFDKDGSDV